MVQGFYEQLVSFANQCRVAYYQNDEPFVSDYAYDMTIRLIKCYEEYEAVKIAENTPTKEVGIGSL